MNEIIEVNRLIEEDPDQFYGPDDRHVPGIYREKLQFLVDNFPRDRGMLHQAAYLMKGLVVVQAFPDSNRRTCHVVLDEFLEWNGFGFKVSTSLDRRMSRALNRIKRKYLRSEFRITSGRCFGSFEDEGIQLFHEPCFKEAIRFLHHYLARRSDSVNGQTPKD